MLYEECLGQTSKTMLAAFPSEQQAEQYGNRIEADNKKSLWPAYCAIATVTPNHLSGLPEGWRDGGCDPEDREIRIRLQELAEQIFSDGL